MHLFISTEQKKSQGLQVWIPRLNLLAEDNQAIEGKWLSDRVINAAQELLKSISTSIGGLQNALLAQNLQFTIERDRFVQILHVSGNHWITIANNGCTGGEIKVYDSMGHSDLPEETKQQVAALIFTSVNKITLTFQTVQRQQDSSSCGLFAVAFATSLCFGSDPSTIMYDSATLRSHLKHCFVSGIMEPFPGKEIKARRPYSHVQYDVFCSCRLTRGKEKMARCDNCLEWFHKSCEKIPGCVFSKSQKWFCHSCNSST